MRLQLRALSSASEADTRVKIDLGRVLGNRRPEGSCGRVGNQLTWVHHYNSLRSHESLRGDTPIERVCQQAEETPLWAAISEAYDHATERIRVRQHAVETALRALK
jgi:hypothetical protein